MLYISVFLLVYVNIDIFNVLFQIMFTCLAESWPARKKWTIEQLVEIYGNTIFRISQKSPKKIMMKFKDYVSYMQVQHDEDPLYIFDEKVFLFKLSL